MFIDTGYRPRRHQEEIHLNLKRFSVLVCHRRFGKTVLAINALVDAASRCQIERPRYGYVAPAYKQAKGVAWDYLKHYTREFPGRQSNEGELYVELPNSARIRLFGADNPDSLRGLYFDGVVLDEVAQMRPEVWGEIIRPSLSDRGGWALFIGTPKGINLFSELYFSACKDPSWYSGMYRASETGIVPDDELAQARKDMSEAQYLQEFECDFSASVENSIMPIQLVEEASRREYHASQYAHAPKILGVDCARFGNNKSSLIFRQGLSAYGLESWRGLDTMQLASIVGARIQKEKPDAVFIDAIGLGGGVVDRLTHLGFNVIGVNSSSRMPSGSRYYNKRAEMWFLCQNWLEEGGSIPDVVSLKNDLVGPTYRYQLNGQIIVESKDDLQSRGIQSPDEGDALVNTFAQPVFRKMDVKHMASYQPRKESSLYWDEE